MLWTVFRPTTTALAPDAVERDLDVVRRHIEDGEIRPQTAFELIAAPDLTDPGYITSTRGLTPGTTAPTAGRNRADMKATPTAGLATSIDRRAVTVARRPRRAAPNSQPIPDPDLCDDVIQQLFAIGLAMRTTQRHCDDQPAVAARITDHMNDLQHVIQQIRSTTLITPGPAAGVTRQADREPETHLECSQRPTTRDALTVEDDPKHERRYVRKRATGNGDAASVLAGGDRPPTPNVLIVDDDPDQLGLLTAFFIRAGCNVISVADAEHALALPRDVDLDLMVLDLRLPGMDGWELTGRLRSRYPRCPIAITSVLDVQDYPAADAALPKPVTKAHIQKLLSATIKRWER